ncbi:MAG: asparaginase [Bacteroidia bacterium]
MKPRALVIYTGGTIGMVKDAVSGSLMPVNIDLLLQYIPELSRIEAEIHIETFETTLDSSDISPEHWIKMVEIIERNYASYDGFVILHGSDTMAYTASALSFLLENLGKPVILTGAQLPIGVLRSDAKENFITALELAVMKENGRSKINEVCIYFEYHLLRGNRTTKYSASHFNAFISPNYEALAEAGVNIQINERLLLSTPTEPPLFHKNLDTHVAVLRLFPGMNEAYVRAVSSIPGLKAMVLETFGAGNAPTAPWFLDIIRKAIEGGILIINVSQCLNGSVEQGKYKTSQQLLKMGVISASDMTREATLCKLMFMLANRTLADLRANFTQDLCGECSAA